MVQRQFSKDTTVYNQWHWNSICKKRTSFHISQDIQKLRLSGSMYLNTSPKTVIFPGENIRERLCHLELDKDFLDMTPKV